MATIVCQGLQSCLESQILEPRRTIRLKLSRFVDEKRCHNDYEKHNSSTADDDSHCWSFLQAISNNGSKLESTTYVHPLDTRSKSTLSEKSLELCTENLGSETGTDIIEDGGGIFSSAPSENGLNVSPRREQQKCAIKKVTARNFPPPLSTICGVASIQVRPHREDGRLIVKATKAPSPHCSLFQAERSHGRLRLSLFKDYEEEEMIENDIAAASCEEEEEDDDDDDDDEGNFDEENEYMGGEEDEDEDEDEGVNGNNCEVGGNMGIKKFKRPGRCKEGEPEKKGLVNWEALWVATS